MERREYERMHALEGRLWWYRGLHGLMVDLVETMTAGRTRPLLDAGCGTGGLLAALGRRRLEARSEAGWLGLEYDPDAAVLAAEKSGAGVVVGSVTALPFGGSVLLVVEKGEVKTV